MQCILGRFNTICSHSKEGTVLLLLMVHEMHAKIRPQDATNAHSTILEGEHVAVAPRLPALTQALSVPLEILVLFPCVHSQFTSCIACKPLPTILAGCNYRIPHFPMMCQCAICMPVHFKCPVFEQRLLNKSLRLASAHSQAPTRVPAGYPLSEHHE